MIIRKRRKNESLNGQVLGSAILRMDAPEFLNKPQFQRELLKEIGRSDRRTVDREFGLIRVLMDQGSHETVKFEPGIVEAFRNRLRVSDSVGWYDDTLAFLLPETDQEGTRTVANSIAQIALQGGVSVDTDISIYPWDDDLVLLSDELKFRGSNRPNTTREPDDSDRPAGGTPENGHLPSANGAPHDATNATDETTMHCQVLSEHLFQSRHSFVRMRPTPWWKRTVDVVAAGTGLLMLSPVFLIAAVAIKSNSRGPVFFRQIREGKNGQPFGILKFRTMVFDAEHRQLELRGQSEQDGPAFKLANDPRVTPVGKYLRKSCVDELPQLVNVLMGQMSLVGPRPLPLDESYACQIWQRTRLTVLPGLTCTWQVRGGRNVTFAQWMRMDLDYIQRRSLWFDLKLILETALIALLHRGSV